MCADTSSANQIAPTQARNKKAKKASAKPGTAIWRLFTRRWLSDAMSYSGKRSAALKVALEGHDDLADLDDNDRMRFARYATGESSMDPVALQGFIMDCRKINLLPPRSGVRRSSEFILESKDPAQMVKDIVDLPQQFLEKRAALLNAIDEYSNLILKADRLHAVIVDTASETHSDYDDSGYMEAVNASDLEKIKKAVRGHHLINTLQPADDS